MGTWVALSYVFVIANEESAGDGARAYRLPELFGRAIALARYALAAIERMAAIGLGASVGGQKARFALDVASWMPPTAGRGDGFP